MKFLNIFDALYQNHFFTTFIVIAIILLSLGFITVLFLGLKDKQKKRKKEEKKEEPKEFSETKEELVKEDVTFEIPSLTKNLEEFKKNLEEEIKKENQNIVLKPEEKETIENLDEKKSPILDQEAIEDTAMVNILVPEDDLEIPKTK